MSYGNVSVTSTPIIIIPANAHRQEFRLVNYSTSPDCFIGMDSSVTTTNGFALMAGSEQDASRSMGSTYLGDIWGVTSSGTADIRWWETTR